MGTSTEIRMNLIGYNEKGFVGFMTGGKYLSYLETPKNSDEIIKKFDLPYISHDQVKDVNKFVDEHPESVDIQVVELNGGENNVRKFEGKKSERSTSGSKRKTRKNRV